MQEEIQCPVSMANCPNSIEAAELAVKKVFAILGVNIDEPKEVEEFRENLRFGATMRHAVNKGMLAMVIVFAGGMMAATWTGIAAKITGH